MPPILSAEPALQPSGLEPSLVIAFLLADIALIVIAARALGAVARRLGQPTVIGEILAGIVLGPTLLGPTLMVWSQPWWFLHCDQALVGTGLDASVTACLFPPQARTLLGAVGQLGLLLFTFLVGLGLRGGNLRGRMGQVAGLTTGVLVAPVAGGMLLGSMLYDETFVASFGTTSQPSRLAFQLAVGALLSGTALPVMAHILYERQLDQLPIATIALTSAAIVTVVMFLLVAVAGAVADGDGGTGPVVLRTSQVAAWLAAMLFVVRPLLGRWVERQMPDFWVTRGVFAAIMSLLVVSGLIAHLLGISVMVGGFVAGVILPARTIFRAQLVPRLEDVTMVVLLPVFLAFSGLQTDFTLLTPSITGAIGLILVVAVAVKWGGGALSARIVGMSWQQSNEIGVLMNCRGLLPLVVALLALEEGLIAPPMQLAAVAMALVTTMMTGPLHDRFAHPHPPQPAETAGS